MWNPISIGIHFFIPSPHHHSQMLDTEAVSRIKTLLSSLHFPVLLPAPLLLDNRVKSLSLIVMGVHHLLLSRLHHHNSSWNCGKRHFNYTCQITHWHCAWILIAVAALTGTSTTMGNDTLSLGHFHKACMAQESIHTLLEADGSNKYCSWRRSCRKSADISIDRHGGEHHPAEGFDSTILTDGLPQIFRHCSKHL